MIRTSQHQLDLFREAVAALGGQAATARYLGTSDRQIRFLCADIDADNRRALHVGFLRDIARALVDHADLCRRLERQLSPAFASNLTAEQQGRG